MRETMFRPAEALRPRIVPSGIFHGAEVQGEVNDLNAVTLGGVSGHAGLFATGPDLARFAQTWLRAGRLPRAAARPPAKRSAKRGARTAEPVAQWWVDSATVRRFLTGGPRAGSRLLGWDTRDTVRAAQTEESSVFGSLLSPAAFGHTGWTGTLLWVDPTRDLFLVFLTNRSFDPRSKKSSFEELRDVRAAVSDAAVRAGDRLCHVKVPAAGLPRC
jgi:CubicO group peptidase (beta-lactamase class C family)